MWEAQGWRALPSPGGNFGERSQGLDHGVSGGSERVGGSGVNFPPGEERAEDLEIFPKISLDLETYIRP
jgi:hypothetical protein